MNINNHSIIKKCIEKQLDLGNKNFVIFPFGDMGMLTQDILRRCYGIKESFIIDNNLCKFNDDIKNISYLNEVDCTKYTFLLATTNSDIHLDLIRTISKYVPSKNIINVIPVSPYAKIVTDCGKYSYGSLCKHPLVEAVGAFSCFASGVDVLKNHAMEYISTHPFLYYGSDNNSIYPTYNECKHREWYFPDVTPLGINQFERIRIGNDVWLGKNVLITNSSDIGNGVIGAAGAVITKSVPDYAVVAGVPAKIIRFRYTPDQIEKLNHIAWWDWSDEKIRRCYNDFFIDIETFIDKHYS